MKTIVIVGMLVSGSALADRSCSEANGAQRAGDLIYKCKAVSTDSVNNCRDDMPCYSLVETIKRGCVTRRLKDESVPEYCLVEYR